MNPSYLVFFSEITNTTNDTIAFKIDCPASATQIPDTDHTFVKLLPSDKAMNSDSVHDFSYGFGEIETFSETFESAFVLPPGSSTMRYFVAFFYQTNEASFNETRGGNRAELLLENEQLYYNLLPQIDKRPIGSIEKR